MPALRSTVLLTLTLAFVNHADVRLVAGDVEWPQFRGPNSTGVVDGPAPPVEFGPGKNELWHVDVGSGHSSPCIAGDSLYVTSFEKEKNEVAVVCVDRTKGRVRWRKPIRVDKLEKGHPSFNPASSSPATDGERVVAYFGSYGLVCFDAKGEKLWEIRMPLAKSFGGNAASPAIFGDRVILYRGNYVDHYLLAVDKKTGKELWKVPQGEPFSGEMACTACPILAGGKLIVHTARSVQAFDIGTGERLWVTKCATTATSTPLVSGKEVLVAAWNKMGEPALRPTFPTFEQLVEKNDKDGDKTISRDEFPRLWIFHRPDGQEAPMNGGTIGFGWADKNKNQEIETDEWASRIRDLEKFRAGYDNHGMLAIPLDSEGVVGKEKVRVLEKQGIPEVPSPLCDGKYIYFVKNGGVLTVLELASGKRLTRVRTGGRGTHYASPLIAGGKIYTVAGSGRISVLSKGAKPEVLAKNDMPDPVYATPAVVDGTLYVRTHQALYAFREAR